MRLHLILGCVWEIGLLAYVTLNVEETRLGLKFVLKTVFSGTAPPLVNTPFYPSCLYSGNNVAQLEPFYKETYSIQTVELLFVQSAKQCK